MSQTIKGKVIKVTQGKPFTYVNKQSNQTMGPFTNQVILIENEDSSRISVSKMTKPETNLTSLEGKVVEAIFTKEERETEHGTIVNNKLVKDGLTEFDSSGHKIEKKTFQQGFGGGAGNSKGQRDGNLLKLAVELGGLRFGKDLPLAKLKACADDIMSLASYIETGGGIKTPPAIKAPVQETSDDSSF